MCLMMFLSVTGKAKNGLRVTRSAPRAIFSSGIAASGASSGMPFASTGRRAPAAGAAGLAAGCAGAPAGAPPGAAGFAAGAPPGAQAASPTASARASGAHLTPRLLVRITPTPTRPAAFLS